MYRIIRYYSGLSLIVMSSSLTLNAQDQKPILKIADEHYDRYEYKLAIPFYEKLAKRKNVKTALLEKLASSYLGINNYQKSAEWYKLIITRSDANPSSYLNYGDMLKSTGNYTKAKEIYAIYKQKGIIDVTARIAGSDSAAVWLSKPTPDQISNLAAVNTPSSEWGAVPARDNTIIFTSDSLRHNLFDKKDKINKNNYNRTGRSFQKLYTYTAGEQDPIKQFSKTINDFKYHVGPVVFSEDQQTAYFTVTNAYALPHKKDKTRNFYGARRLELYSSKFKDGQWQKPESFAFNNAANFSVGHAALSKNGNILYFASDMPGGIGKTDIWYSEKSADGSWGTPKNCGPAINTTEDEEFPTVTADVLYFSSKGHAGIGGFDIFSSQGQKDQWSAVLNLKSPLNSQGDDFYLVMKDETSGYFASNRPGGAGDDDIYTYKRLIIPPLVPEKPVTPAAAVSPVIPAVTTPIIPAVAAPVIAVKKPAKGERFIINYDFDKSDIRPDASLILDSLAELMHKYPKMSISLSSHTDSRGKAAYNLALSQRRAKAALTYLIQKGISSQRIQARGHGKNYLVNHCKDGVNCTDKAHEVNRRTEVIILTI